MQRREQSTSPFVPTKAQSWAVNAFALLYAQLSDETEPSNIDLAPCGQQIISQLREVADPACAVSRAPHILEFLEGVSEAKIKSEFISHKAVPLHLRRLYTDCRLLHSLLDLRDFVSIREDDEIWTRAVRRLDMAIIVAGAPGEGRLDLIQDLIELIQAEHLPAKYPSQNHYSEPVTKHFPSVIIDSLAPNPIPRISPPSLSTFRSKFSSSPFILSGFIIDWPALKESPWRFPSYLQRIAGRGRIVPVEVGSDYCAEEWDQRMISWEEFLLRIGMGSEPDLPLDNIEGKTLDAEGGCARTEVLYLAQHNLLTQFPALRSDIIVPDYVYGSLPPPQHFPAYLPPGNDEQLVINAWLGPKGTVSPAHTDPYFNCYAQVVGRKSVWLAPPHLQDEMYPFPNPGAPYTNRNDPSLSTPDGVPSGNQPSLANTSRVDVFAKSPGSNFPLFNLHARPHALCAVLQPGDLLYVPPGWWHAMRSEDVSFSVSMWF